MRIGELFCSHTDDIYEKVIMGVVGCLLRWKNMAQAMYLPSCTASRSKYQLEVVKGEHE